MSPSTISAAPEHLPFFVTAPGETDLLLLGSAVFLVVSFIFVGTLYLRLHHIPDHIAHKGQKIQYEVVAVLALLAMVTHNNNFWIAALLLAIAPIPDFVRPFNEIAASLARMASKWSRSGQIKSVNAPPTKKRTTHPEQNHR